MEASESTVKNNSGKTSSNSFIFMKNNPHSIRKGSSNAPKAEEGQQEKQDAPNPAGKFLELHD